MNSSIFMFMIFVIGIVLTYSSWNIDSNLESKTCTDVSLKRSNKGVFVIGISFIVSALSFAICEHSKGSSGGGFEPGMGVYSIFLLLLGIVLVVLGSIISSKSKGACKDAKSYSKTIWLMGVLMVLMSGSYIGMQIYGAKSSTNHSFRF